MLSGRQRQVDVLSWRPAWSAIVNSRTTEQTNKQKCCFKKKILKGGRESPESFSEFKVPATVGLVPS